MIKKEHKNQRPLIGRQVPILATVVVFIELVRNITGGNERRKHQATLAGSLMFCVFKLRLRVLSRSILLHFVLCLKLLDHLSLCLICKVPVTCFNEIT